MRIVHVIPALTKGGAEKVLVDLANEAHRRGHEVSIIAGQPADPRLIRDRLDPAIDLQVVSPREGQKLTAYGALPLWLWRRRAWFDGVDVVHCHLTYAAVLGTLLKVQRRLRGQRRPAIVETFHGVGMPIRPRQRWLAAALARGRDGFAVMAEDPFWSDFLRRHPALLSAVIPNGLAIDAVPSSEEVSAWRRNIGIPMGMQIVGTIGRIRAERNPFATLAAFAVVARHIPEVHFIMGGDGPMIEAVRTKATELGLGQRLHLPGLVVDPQAAIGNMDLYLSMNVGSITGIAGLEAAAMGVPLISLQAREDYRTGHCDWIWSDPDPLVVGNKLTRLLQSPAELEAIGRHQRAHVAAKYSVAAMQDAYERLYAAAIEAK